MQIFSQEYQAIKPAYSFKHLYLLILKNKVLLREVVSKDEIYNEKQKWGFTVYPTYVDKTIAYKLADNILPSLCD